MRRIENIFDAVVIGVSAGGMKALPVVLGALGPDFAAPVIVLQHVGPESDQAFFAEYLQRHTRLKLREAMERETVEVGRGYIAPSKYHLLVESSKTFSLSKCPKVNYSRPSIDVLFESAAKAFGPGAVGVILTGANHDGAAGLAQIKSYGGIAIVQDPREAESPVMPTRAIEACPVDHVLPLTSISAKLLEIVGKTRNDVAAGSARKTRFASPPARLRRSVSVDTQKQNLWDPFSDSRLPRESSER